MSSSRHLRFHCHPQLPNSSDTDDPAPPFAKPQILKNVIVLSLGWAFLFTAFNAVANLQTSLNQEDGVGVKSLTTIYVGMIASSMFLSDVVVSLLGCKWAISLAMSGYTMYIAANFYAVQVTMIPAAVVLGLCSAPLWSAQSTYLTKMGGWYAKLTHQNKDGAINYFFGFFYMSHQSTQIWGNLISSLVFAPTIGNETSGSACGAAFCPETSRNVSLNFEQPTENVYTVCGIFLGCAVIGMAIIIKFLDNVHMGTSKSSRLSHRLLISAFNHLFTSPKQMLLVPITIYRGLGAALFVGEFTKAFVSCALGIWNLGYVMICFGVANALSSVISGRLVKFVGQMPFFVVAFLVHMGLQIAFLWWDPSRDEVTYFYISAALWGVGNAIFQTQSNALYGCLFTDSLGPAFANYRLWEGSGAAVAYAYSDLFCTNIKIYICLGVLTAGMLGYIVVMLMERIGGQKKCQVTE